MKSLDLSILSWNDFFVNGVFFIADLMLLSILIPIIIWIFDHLKWSAARKKIGERSAHYLDLLDFTFTQLTYHVSSIRNAMPEATSNNPKAYTEDGLKRQKLAVFDAFRKGLDRLEKNSESNTNNFLQEMQLLAPAFNSQIAIESIVFYESVVRLNSIALAALNIWVLVGSQGLSKIVFTDAHQDNYLNSVSALENLCKATRLKFKRTEGQLLIPKAGDIEKGELTKHYPNHDPFYVKMKMLFEVLSAPILKKVESSSSELSEDNTKN